ncbi:MAG TPA: serine racemase VanT catalytic subunit [Candidatus Mediterraneibacter faecavium]|uniref:Alanine racemase n=1 Tax=Candidatus Mediterraneibacter faecavium TaxID=2838668 RepID=A0A9D2TND4_9FIRM|nr:serine racemase VanT catalytic subunit [Candidatus Mediterraneibacter faecavium]
MHETDRAWISIDKENLLHNVKELRRLSGAGCALMPAVKANAYGHGDVLVCRILQDAGIRDYCVASVDEGIRLRQAGISGQILILGYTHPDGFAELMHYRLTQTAVDLDCAGRLSVYAGKVNCGRTAGNRDTIAVHVGVDTGMHRLGIPYDRTDLIEKVWGLPDLRVTGLFSHLCVSDGLTDAEEKYTREQIQRFDQAADYLHKKSIRGFKCHIQGSYGLLNYPEYSYDLSRPGIALYGCLSSADDRVRASVSLKPVLSLKARAASIKELPAGESAGYGLTYTADSTRRIAIVSVGYADGIPRSLSNCGEALVRGRKIPVIGRICMDQLTLDVTDVPGILPGDEVVLIGSSGECRLTAEDMAGKAGTITNEILSRLGGRLRRVVA